MVGRAIEAQTETREMVKPGAKVRSARQKEGRVKQAGLAPRGLARRLVPPQFEEKGLPVSEQEVVGVSTMAMKADHR